MADTYQEQQKRIVNALKADPSKRVVEASIVPIQSDYEDDPAICLTSVVFIPEDISQDIIRIVVEPLMEANPEHHYYSSDSIHLTIKNIRTIHNPPLFTNGDIEKVNSLFSKLIPHHQSFTFSLEEIVAFTTSVSLIGYCDKRLQVLVQALNNGLNDIGVPDNKHYISDTVFFGNLTLCRFVHKPSKRFLRVVEQMTHIYHCELSVEVIHLITCNLVCSPESRKVLYSYKLKECQRQGGSKSGSYTGAVGS